jgi:hypothetical protein
MSEKQIGTYEVYDARKESQAQPLRFDTESEAKSWEKKINEYIYSNTLGMIFGPAKEVKGPFYTRKVAT